MQDCRTLPSNVVLASLSWEQFNGGWIGTIPDPRKFRVLLAPEELSALLYHQIVACQSTAGPDLLARSFEEGAATLEKMSESSLMLPNDISLQEGIRVYGWAYKKMYGLIKSRWPYAVGDALLSKTTPKMYAEWGEGTRFQVIDGEIRGAMLQKQERCLKEYPLVLEGFKRVSGIYKEITGHDLWWGDHVIGNVPLHREFCAMIAPGVELHHFGHHSNLARWDDGDMCWKRTSNVVPLAKLEDDIASLIRSAWDGTGWKLGVVAKSPMETR